MSEKVPILPQQEGEKKAIIEVAPEYEKFIPADFRNNPIEYFESQGKNIKPGEIKLDEAARVKEDPTAVKELPVWADGSGNELETIGKRVNVLKGEVGESQDPFYEANILRVVHSLGLPAPRLIAQVSSQSEHLIIMEKAAGISWYDKESLKKNLAGYSKAEIEELKQKAEALMHELKERFDEAGIIRDWKLKDMIFNIDFERQEIISITPTDWERTKIDKDKLSKAHSK